MLLVYQIIILIYLDFLEDLKAENMIKTDFNKGWLFCREGETERIAVDVPHDAMLREPRTDDSEGGTNTGWFAGCDFVPHTNKGTEFCVTNSFISSSGNDDSFSPCSSSDSISLKYESATARVESRML